MVAGLVDAALFNEGVQSIAAFSVGSDCWGLRGRIAAGARVADALEDSLSLKGAEFSLPRLLSPTASSLGSSAPSTQPSAISFASLLATKEKVKADRAAKSFGGVSAVNAKGSQWPMLRRIQAHAKSCQEPIRPVVQTS